jgi:hypothetical protein
MDPIGLIAEAASVKAAAPCLHEVIDYITPTALELVRGQYPMCDFNPTNGVKHSILATTQTIATTQTTATTQTITTTFGFCRECSMVMCNNCNLRVAEASVLLITRFNIFQILLSNSKKLFLSVFVKHRSVTPYIFVGLCSLFILFFSFDFSVISCDAPRA